jgi:hypothetical protein
MVTALRLTQMVLNLKVTLKMVTVKVRVSFCFPTSHYTRVNLLKTGLKAKEFSNGQMANLILELG